MADENENLKQDWLIRVHYDQHPSEGFVLRQFGFQVARGVIKNLSEQNLSHHISSNWFIHSTKTLIKRKLTQNWRLIKEKIPCKILVFPIKISLEVWIHSANENIFDQIIKPFNVVIKQKSEPGDIIIADRSHLYYELSGDNYTILEIEKICQKKIGVGLVKNIVIHAGSEAYSWRPEIEQEKVLKKETKNIHQTTKPKI